MRTLIGPVLTIQAELFSLRRVSYAKRGTVKHVIFRQVVVNHLPSECTMRWM